MIEVDGDVQHRQEDHHQQQPDHPGPVFLPRTGGYYINLSTCNYGLIRECTFVGGYSGIGLTGSACTGMHLRDVRFQSLTHNGIDVVATTIIDLIISKL